MNVFKILLLILCGIGTSVVFFHAWRQNEKIWESIRAAAGSPRHEAISRLCLTWLVPIIMALLTLVLTAHFFNGDEIIGELQREFSKPKPEPFKERLLACLNEIDPGMLSALRNEKGNLRVNGYMSQSLFVELQKLSDEPESHKYMTIVHVEAGGLVLGQEEPGPSGRAVKVTLLLDKALLDK